jgi:hypothetical protein
VTDLVPLPSPATGADQDERERIRQDIADAEHERLMVERYEEPYYYGGGE